MTVTPPPVEAGDQVAIIHNRESDIDDQDFEKGIQNLKDIFEVTPVQYPILNESLPRKNRIQKMNKVLIDESITGAFVVSNGKGYIQLINNLDEEIIKTNPIWLFGVGDSTYLQLYFHQLGISSVYGGQINGQISELTDNELINIYRNILSDNTTGNLYLEETITQAPTRSNKGEQVDNEPVQGSTWGVRLKEYPGFYL